MARCKAGRSWRGSPRELHGWGVSKPPELVELFAELKGPLKSSFHLFFILYPFRDRYLGMVQLTRLLVPYPPLPSDSRLRDDSRFWMNTSILYLNIGRTCMHPRAPPMVPVITTRFYQARWLASITAGASQSTQVHFQTTLHRRIYYTIAVACSSPIVVERCRLCGGFPLSSCVDHASQFPL